MTKQEIAIYNELFFLFIEELCDHTPVSVLENFIYNQFQSKVDRLLGFKVNTPMKLDGDFSWFINKINNL